MARHGAWVLGPWQTSERWPRKNVSLLEGTTEEIPSLAPINGPEPDLMYWLVVAGGCRACQPDCQPANQQASLTGSLSRNQVIASLNLRC
jgi:hypothetical protein